MFSIGDQVFVARYGHAESWDTCIECFGKKTITVILGDDSREVIDCVGCASGCESPKGVIRTVKGLPEVETKTITGMEIDRDGADQKIKYKAGCYVLDAENVFATHDEAMERAKTLAAQAEKEQEDYNLVQKKTRNRTWAWNVHYYRMMIREAERQIEVYTERLHRALPKVKEEKIKATQ